MKITAFVITAIVVYGALIPPRRVVVTNHDVELSGLSDHADGLRVVQLSDLHVSPLFRAGSIRKIVRLANACKPDIVVLTGDFVNYGSMKYLPDAMEELKNLKAPLGVFACLGNHDYWEGVGQVRGIIEKGGIEVLVNENITLDNGLCIAAVDDMMSGSPDVVQTLDGIPENSPALLLSHNPTVLPEVSKENLFVISGHTHGGQIAAPFLGPRSTVELPGINSFTKFYESLGVRSHHGQLDTVATYRYPEGWYKEGNARMYVCRGVGFSLSVPIRFNCSPEIACFTLRRASH